MRPFLKVFVSCIILASSSGIMAQMPMMGGGKGGGQMTQFMSAGHVYGKVVDSLTQKPVEFASIQLFGNKFDNETKKIRIGLINGQLTKENGDFSLESLSVMGEYTLKISLIGYQPYEQKVIFNMGDLMKNMSKSGMGNAADPGKAMSAMSGALNYVDVDLGNIRLKPDTKLLKEVEVNGSAPLLELKLDKKVFNVEKNITTTGGTAENVLKSVPSVNVDVDGNVTLRNSTPQIFVDGRPTTLTLDQIPADAIEKVEVITNPSAKYDASGGGAGIINIVLKKSRKLGYNGSIRSGIDSRGRLNEGLDISSREGKVNVFASAFYNQIKSVGTSQVTRYNLTGSPLTNVYQDDNNTTQGHFLMGRAGFDYFINNRNTVTLTGLMGKGLFQTDDRITSLDSTSTHSFLYRSTRSSLFDRDFNTLGGTAQYKHLYPKAGREWTADVNYYSSKSSSSGNFQTDFQRNAGSSPSTYQQQKGDGQSRMLITQVDYVNPITDKLKIESGLRGSFRSFQSGTGNYILNSTTQQYELIGIQSYRYQFDDNVLAAYSTLSQEFDKFSYQVGLRGESSTYKGELLDSAKTFTTNFPLSLFPSGFVSYKLSESSTVQLSYTRRINRPGFFQLIPFIDYSDSLNLSRGNPALKPEFTDAMELNYSQNINRSNSILISAYMRNTTGLITRFQTSEYNAILKKSVIINTYENANSAYSYGLELTSRNSPLQWLDVISNLNVYDSRINGSNLESNLTNEQLSWFAKLNITLKLPKNLSLQLMGDYQSKTVLPPNSGGGRWGGMGMMSASPGATAQGYIKPYYGVDIAVKYEFLKDKMASLTLNISDVFKTRRYDVHSESAYFIQNSLRLKDQQLLRLTFTYRFGKFDVSLFKRKNLKGSMEGAQDMMGM